MLWLNYDVLYIDLFSFIELPSILGNDCLHIAVLKSILYEVDKELGLFADLRKDEPQTGILYSVL